MKFTLISDVHVEHNSWNWDLLRDCDPQIPMVVAGDISNDVFETSFWIKRLRQLFPVVIWVAGNHDMFNLGLHRTALHDARFSAAWPYPQTVPEIYDHYAKWSLQYDVHFLNRSTVSVNGIQFVGATGWHDFNAAPHLSLEDQTQAWRNYMMDARYISWHTGSLKDHKPVLQAACDDAKYLLQAVKVNREPKVVITHHIPHRNFVKVTADPVWNLLNGSFLNTGLESCVDDSIRAWCFGHTHFRFDQVQQGVRYLNNAKGYPGENENWFPVEIEV